MTTTFQIETDRLLLRPLDEADRDDFVAMNADSDVMTYFVSPMTREESYAAFTRYTTHFQQNGFAFLAALLLGATVLISGGPGILPAEG